MRGSRFLRKAERDLLNSRVLRPRIRNMDDSGMPVFDGFDINENETADDSNNSLKMDEVNAILSDFYNNLNSETNYLLITLYVPVIVLAVTANILVIVVVLKYHYMRRYCPDFSSVTNYFLVNLSVADLLVTTICMPIAVSQAVTMIWVYGEIMCKLFFYLQVPMCKSETIFAGVAVAASVFTITAMSIDRYLAIRSPIAFRRVFNRRSTILVIAALWLVALSIFAPVLRAVTLSPMSELDNITIGGQRIEHPTFYVCSEDFKPLGIHTHIFGAACFVLVYAIPGFIVILAYSMMGRTLCARKPPFDCDSIEGSASSQQGFRLVRERRRVAWILLLLAVLFALCWLPYNVLRLLMDLGALGSGRNMSDVLSYCLFLGHANSALNPIVYCFMTRNFRRSVSEILFRSRHALARRKPHRKTTGPATGTCIGCSGCGVTPDVPWTDPSGQEVPRCHLCLTQDQFAAGQHRGATTSSGYDTFYSRHNPHRRCYMMKAVCSPQRQGREQCQGRKNQEADSSRATCLQDSGKSCSRKTCDRTDSTRSKI
ncbi:RYamide receptor-like isoform X1 [Neodiprion pinetum]|uniref:RYamide receptor-like isoform X1 n=1 Tax=Neodiprion pinetum TaxID=441929 RepID=UPI001EDFD373|nr:RYamide receptor-like isoform X1 [Neodiprion pinetum]